MTVGWGAAPLFGAVGLLGLVVGSFLNVVIYRVPRAESLLWPGSRCPNCQVAIRPWHNVPVLGWLVLRGRCASCLRAISPRCPLVEAGTAALFGGVAAGFGASAALPAYLYLAAVAVALSMIDVDVRRLPDVIVLPSYLVGVVLLVPAGAAAGWSGYLRGGLAAGALLAFYLALALLYPGGMGLGDVKLAGLLGWYLGWLGWGQVLVGTFAAFLLGGAVGVALMVTRGAGRRSAIPFGPAMLAGALVALLFAGPVLRWYGAMLTISG